MDPIRSKVEPETQNSQLLPLTEVMPTFLHLPDADTSRNQWKMMVMRIFLHVQDPQQTLKPMEDKGYAHLPSFAGRGHA